jgi:DNA-binding transcriptional LysR family regulator
MEDIEAFLAVVEAGSQTSAARQLGRSLQSVNRSLGRVDEFDQAKAGGEADD